MEQFEPWRKSRATLRERVESRRAHQFNANLPEREWTAPRPAVVARDTVPIRRSRSYREEQAYNSIGVLQQARRGTPRPPVAIEEWLSRGMALLLVGVVAVGFLLHGCSVRQPRESAASIFPAARASVSVDPAATAKSAASSAAAPAPDLVSLPISRAKKTTFLILGSDRREQDASFRTDVIVLVTVDPAKGEVSAVSFPRDLIAKIPGIGDDRINVVMQYGGFELMQETFASNFGARPQYYFMVNFENFVGLINSIGGIEVEAAQPLSDACDLYWSRGGQCGIEPGKHEMDGATALWYIRSRHTSSDFDRLRRAQEVLVGIFARFMSMNALARGPELFKQYSASVETNMEIHQALALLPVAAWTAQDPNRVHRYAISPDEAADWWMPSGAQVLLPDYEAVRRIVQEAGAGE